MSALTSEQARVVAALMGVPIYKIQGKWYREATVQERMALQLGDICLIGASVLGRRSWEKDAPTEVTAAKVVRYDPSDTSVRVENLEADSSWQGEYWVNTNNDFERIVVEL